MACCSKSQIKAKRVAVRKATNTANALNKLGKVAQPKQVSGKKITGKKVSGKKVAPCTACGKKK